MNTYQQTYVGCFLRGKEGDVQVRDLVFIEGCVIWAALGNHAIIKICPSYLQLSLKQVS